MSPCVFESEVSKLAKNTSKAIESNSIVSEKKLTARQLSKQDALGESVSAQKTKDPSVPSTSSVESTVKQPTRFSTRIVKRPRRDLSPPESPIKKGVKRYIDLNICMMVSFSLVT